MLMDSLPVKEPRAFEKSPRSSEGRNVFSSAKMEISSGATVIESREEATDQRLSIDGTKRLNINSTTTTTTVTRSRGE